MEYGFCTGFASVPLWQIEEDMILDIKASGYDYPEFPVMSFAEMSEEEFSRLEKMGIEPYLLADATRLASLMICPAA